MHKLSLFWFWLLPVAGWAQPIRLQPVWETDTLLRTPESVLFHPGQRVLYVSCVNGAPTLDNKQSFIAKVGLDGKIIQRKFVDGLNATKGMGILGDKLYVTEMKQVVQISLASGKVLSRYPVQGASFLNDIAIDTIRRIIYVTDSKASKVWAIRKGKARLLASGAPLQETNGLLVDQAALLIGNGDGSLLRFNPLTRQLTSVTTVRSETSIDGIVALGGRTYLINEVAGKFWQVGDKGTAQLVLDLSLEKIQSADTDYDRASRLLFVPTLFHNTVRAYRVN